MMNKIKIWVKAARLPFLTATVIPITLGAVVAYDAGQGFHWGYFLLAMLGGILIHLGVNLSNDYFDHLSGNDWNNKTPTPFAGGSRAIQNGELKPSQILIAALSCFAFGSGIGLYLNHILAGNIILYLGLIGVFLGFFYTGIPIKIGYRGLGLGELSVGLGFGPIMVLGSYYVQTEQLSISPLLASVPVLILIALVLYINEFPDYEADRSVNKKTIPVVLGLKKAAYIFYLLLTGVYLYTLILVILGIFPLLSLITLLTLPLALKAIRVTRMYKDKPYQLIPANASVIMLHLSFGVCLILSYLVTELFL
ncbi:MAG: 1,4-dihydroxy-2-naphthoate octaprenyltransferase [Planctomycetota bacterium]|nr:1,4-dihydroxy-2-naphthoate octaprenyltransferase [Planctomycetota bacterium]MDI6788551.1 1,4-dihydroxy-2-naphthoate octaprenyltransferase [Planctomycetota bacterium]